MAEKALEELRIQRCHSSSLGSYCGLGLIPGLGTFSCHGLGQKKKKKKKRKKEKEKALDLQANIPHLSPYLLAE